MLSSNIISLTRRTAVLTSVGAYQLEGMGRAVVRQRIEGDFATILGLPLLDLLAFLREHQRGDEMTTAAGPRAGVMGWPVDHSRSPRLHGYWLRHYGIDGGYDRLPVPPEDLGKTLAGPGRRRLSRREFDRAA